MVQPDTPSKGHFSSLDIEYHSAGVEKARNSLMTDVPLVPIVKLDSILSAILPVGEDQLEEVFSSLLQNGKISTNNGTERWVCFGTDPAASTVHEKSSFAPLTTIWNSILRSMAIQQPRLSLNIEGDSALYSPRGNKSRPDAYFHFAAASFTQPNRDTWFDAVMPMEFKKKSSPPNEKDNLRKVVWSMHEIMRTDPRRRFVTGLTIENTQARLFFHDRCSVVASEFFDVHEKWRKLTHIFLALASFSDLDLGFDPCCRAVPNSSQPHQFDFTFGTGESYRTVEIISNVGVNNLLGHGTRVWKVQKLGRNGKPTGPLYALKDAWEHCGREPEHVIVDKIRKKQPDAAKHFLTILNAEFVTIGRGKDLIEDDTGLSIRRGCLLEETGERYHALSPDALQVLYDISTKGSATQTPTHPPLAETKVVQGHRAHDTVNKFPRRHFRMISAEVGDSVHHIRDFQKALVALEGGVIGLHAGHISGYVHRDVSAGNVMYYDGAADSLGERGIIMDWEYGKEPDSNASSRDVKTGTVAYMSVEVSSGNYQHIPPTDELNLSASSEEIEKSMAALDIGAKPPVFRQNFLHDYESCWWIALYLIFTFFAEDRLRTEDYVNNHAAVFASTGLERIGIWSLGAGGTYNSHLDQKSERMYLQVMKLWNTELKGAYTRSYSDRKFWIIDPALTIEVYKAELRAIELLKTIVKDYPPNLVHYRMLKKKDS